MVNITDSLLTYNNYNVYNLSGKINFSFELFPPKNDISKKYFFSCIKHLSPLKPNFFSITNSVDQNNKKKTMQFIQEASLITTVPLVPHLTSLGSTNVELTRIAKKYWSQGIKSIISLRGDIPSEYKNVLTYATDLIQLLKNIANFNIIVAAYPEIHPESFNIKTDLDNLKKKVDLGASCAITQFFFDIEKFLRFRDNCIKHGINIEIIPGILPILDIQQLNKFSAITNVSIPIWIIEVFQFYKNNNFICNLISINIIIDLLTKLYSEGVVNFHFYTLNRFNLIIKILKRLGIFYNN